jgi:hypothetical protein
MVGPHNFYNFNALTELKTVKINVKLKLLQHKHAQPSSKLVSAAAVSIPNGSAGVETETRGNNYCIAANLKFITKMKNLASDPAGL